MARVPIWGQQDAGHKLVGDPRAVCAGAGSQRKGRENEPIIDANRTSLVGRLRGFSASL